MSRRAPTPHGRFRDRVPTVGHRRRHVVTLRVLRSNGRRASRCRCASTSSPRCSPLGVVDLSCRSSGRGSPQSSHVAARSPLCQPQLQCHARPARSVRLSKTKVSPSVATPYSRVSTSTTVLASRVVMVTSLPRDPPRVQPMFPLPPRLKRAATRHLTHVTENVPPHRTRVEVGRRAGSTRRTWSNGDRLSAGSFDVRCGWRRGVGSGRARATPALTACSRRTGDRSTETHALPGPRQLWALQAGVASVRREHTLRDAQGTRGDHEWGVHRDRDLPAGSGALPTLSLSHPRVRVGMTDDEVIDAAAEGELAWRPVGGLLCVGEAPACRPGCSRLPLHGPPRQWSMRWWSGWNPWSRPHSMACDRPVTPILR